MFQPLFSFRADEQNKSDVSRFSFFRDNAPFLAVGLLLTFNSSFGQTYFISVFAGAIRGEFGLSHGGWGTIYAAGTMVSAAVMLWSGALTDVFRVRSLAVVVLGGLAAACVAMAALPTVWLLPMVIFALRFFGQGMSSHVATVSMARWFEARRGRALSIASLGFALGEGLLPVTFVALLTVAHWRALWIVAAVITLCLLPIVVRLLRHERTPQSVAENQTAVGMLGRHWTRPDTLRHWLFWATVPMVLGPGAFGTAFFFHQVHIAEVKGWAHLELVSVFPLFPLSATVSMVASGWLIDRFGTTWLMPVSQVPVALAFMLFPQVETLPAAGLCIMLMALTFGTNATLPGAFWAEYFGTRHLGAIKSLATAVMVLGSALGPGITGILIDAGMPFPDQMIWIGLYFICAIGIVLVALMKARRLLPATQVDVVRA